MATYRHTPEMGEISGFGEGYEQACQDMLEAGVKWLLEQPEQPVDLQYKGLSGVVGVCIATNENGDKLDEVILASVEDCTVAMHHSVVSRIMFINKNGWNAYVDYMKRNNAKSA